jgi:hypothetical protein
MRSSISITQYSGRRKEAAIVLQRVINVLLLKTKLKQRKFKISSKTQKKSKKKTSNKPDSIK